MSNLWQINTSLGKSSHKSNNSARITMARAVCMAALLIAVAVVACTHSTFVDTQCTHANCERFGATYGPTTQPTSTANWGLSIAGSSAPLVSLTNHAHCIASQIEHLIMGKKCKVAHGVCSV